MKVVNVHEAKTTFSRLLARVARGERIVIAKAGEPVAELVPTRSLAARRPGLLPGLRLDAAFWEPLSEAELGDWER
jgi:prevent-host-death family protein